VALAERIKELRVKKKLSLQDVADAVGASKAHIWDLETGRAKNPSIELVTKLARCFDVSISDLLGENPGTDGAESQLVAMYRDLKELTPDDRKAIQSMMDHFRKRES
jgi:transcriptional regulator with XRE-family HTH domain